MGKNEPLSLEDARALGLLEGLSEGTKDFLSSRLGKPTGPDGIPYTACFMAGMRTKTAGTGQTPENGLLALITFLGMLISIFTIMGLDKWVYFLLRPIRIRFQHRKTTLPLSELKQCDRVFFRLTYNSPFVTFYRWQCMASGLFHLVVGISTCCIGTFILLIPNWLRGMDVLDAAFKGKWKPALFVGNFIMQRTRPLRSYQREPDVEPTPALTEDLDDAPVEQVAEALTTPPNQ